MPRPQRVQQREAARAEKVAARAEEIDPATDPIDGGGETGQSLRSGPVEDGDFIREVAKRAGWSAEKERDGKPIENWQDERAYLLKLPDAYAAREALLKERLKRTDQVIEAAAEEARRTALQEAEARHTAAVRAGDEDGAKQAVVEIARNSGPHPSTVAWIARNPWFTANGRQGDDEATAVAITAIKRAESVGAKVEEALKAGEDAVRKRFPEHFGDARPEPATPLRQPDPVPPAVVPGSRGAITAKPKERGWRDIPSEDRKHLQRFADKAVRSGRQTEAQATAFLANAYWAEKA